MLPKRIKLRGCAFHLIGRTDNKRPFNTPLEKLWKIFAVQLDFLTFSQSIRVHAFLLMGNHFHLLVSVEEDKISQITDSLKKSMNEMSGENLFNEILITKIESPVYYHFAYKYIYRNPVSAGLCSLVEAYPFTSLQNILGRKTEAFLIFDNMNLIQNPIQVLRWLNQPSPYPPEIEELNYLFG